MRAIIVTLLLLLIAPYSQACEIQSYFSPADNIEKVVISNLSQAKKSVHLSLYGIANRRLAEKLVELKKAGVEVTLCEDKTQAAGAHDQHTYLEENGVRVVIKKTGVLEHNKFAIIDGSVVIMGSWNWSVSAQKQDNSDMVIKDCPEEVQKFEDAFKRILERDSK